MFSQDLLPRVLSISNPFIHKHFTAFYQIVQLSLGFLQQNFKFKNLKKNSGFYSQFTKKIIVDKYMANSREYFLCWSMIDEEEQESIQVQPTPG